MSSGVALPRRVFLRRSGAVVASAAAAGAAPPKREVVALVLDGADPVASARPALWAAHELQQALYEAGYAVRRCQFPQQADTASLSIIASGSTAPVAISALKAGNAVIPGGPEALALLEGTLSGRRTVLACGSDPRGLTYALLDLADRARLRPHALPTVTAPVLAQPATPVRSVMRQFVSEPYDKPWFYDRAMWPRYLTMLATHRFNRFNLSFGLGYDQLKNVGDSYALFLYPFLLAVPGYDVSVTNLPEAERDRNLQALRFISDQTAACGLDFQLGIWMHGYALSDSPNARYVVQGLTPDNHASYCRDALTALLKALPAVSSVALRIHGESGVAEGSYAFWETVFEGVARCGRPVEIDLHAKGVDFQMIANALATGMPVNVSPKFAAEHLGLPYHQADIRPGEIPSSGSVGRGLMTLSEGQRSFTRYGYADLLRDDRKYTVRSRVFAGTQRILASGSVAAAAAYARAFLFGGMTGADLMEPLTCRGRRGSTAAGIPRSGYANARFETRYDWQKFDHWYRTFGRKMFDPDGDAEACRRPFDSLGTGAALQAAFEGASRILPLVTSAHSESAACDLYWPEVYWNLPMAAPAPDGFWDTPSPKTFQNATALDPQMFSSCGEFAGELLGERSGKYSPVEVAGWLDALAEGAQANLSAAGRPATVDAMRIVVDAQVQILLGRFFAAKLRSGVLMALHERNPDRQSLEACLAQYRLARGHWAAIVERTKGVYAADLSVSDRYTERGQWSDRLADIDADIAALEGRLAAAAAAPNGPQGLAEVLEPPKREPLACAHLPPSDFVPGRAVALQVAVGRTISVARLWYRHVSQAERWQSVDMQADTATYGASIAAEYTNSPYALQYYFEFRDRPRSAWLYPGFAPDLLNPPYITLTKRRE